MIREIKKEEIAELIQKVDELGRYLTNHPEVSGEEKESCEYITQFLKKEGYEEASAEYEHKLIEQADLFLKQTRVFEEERDEYEKLLDEYDKEIELLENKADKTDRENKYLQELLLKERKLIQLIPEDEDET